MENGRYVEEMTQSDAERGSTKMDRKKKIKESRENTMRSPDKASRVSKEKTQDPEDGQSVNRTENSVHSEKKSRPPVKSSNPSKETAKKAQQSKETPKKSKELARASKEPMKKPKEKEMPSKPSVTKSPKTNQRKQTKEKLSKEKDNKGEDEPAAEHQSKERPPPLDFEELQLVCRNSNPVKYNTDHYQQQLQYVWYSNTEIFRGFEQKGHNSYAMKSPGKGSVWIPRQLAKTLLYPAFNEFCPFSEPLLQPYDQVDKNKKKTVFLELFSHVLK